MMDSDEFNKFIEVDEKSDSEKENQEVRRIRQPRTTKDQFDKIFEFMKEHNEGLIDNETYSSLWENLAAALNDIGPPDHTTAEWKKIWSEHKKRKCLGNASLETDGQRKTSDKHVFRPSGSVVESVETGATDTGTNTCKRIKFYSEILEKLSVLIEKHNVLIKQQDEIIQKLEISNNLMQEMARKPYEAK